jgi:WhiB family transcriptional regulator, redox-sensing transcriptional regulator
MYEIGSGASAGPAASRRAVEDEPAQLSDRQLLERVTSTRARCVGTAVDPDAWFPVATRWQQARAEAASALALCAVCPVRAECLEFSMRQWGEVGRHGVWGGLLEVERAAVRKHWLAGVSVARLLVRGQKGPRPAEAGDETHKI